MTKGPIDITSAPKPISRPVSPRAPSPAKAGDFEAVLNEDPIDSSASQRVISEPETAASIESVTDVVESSRSMATPSEELQAYLAAMLNPQSAPIPMDSVTAEAFSPNLSAGTSVPQTTQVDMPVTPSSPVTPVAVEPKTLAQSSPLPEMIQTPALPVAPSIPSSSVGVPDPITPRTPRETKEELVAQVPVLALLTGRLDKIEPAVIPELVSENGFIKDALASTDIEAFMSTPQPVREILTELGLHDHVAEMVSQGLPPDAQLTSRQLLQSLHIDPGVVASELEMLKANLPLEGVATYIERAEKMQPVATESRPVETPASDSVVSKGLTPGKTLTANDIPDLGLTKDAIKPTMSADSARIEKFDQEFSQTSSEPQLKMSEPQSAQKLTKLEQAIESLISRDWKPDADTKEKRPKDDSLGITTSLPNNVMSFEPNLTENVEKAPEQAQDIREQVAEIAENTQKVTMEADQKNTVVLDLSTPEHGKLDVKLEVQDDKVEIKVLAASDKMKEQLAADATRLREAFHASQLDLHRFDLGSFRQFDRSQDQQSFSANQDDSRSSILEKVAPKRSLTQGAINRAFRASHLGSIQVLA